MLAVYTAAGHPSSLVPQYPLQSQAVAASHNKPRGKSVHLQVNMNSGYVGFAAVRLGKKVIGASPWSRGTPWILEVHPINW